MRPVLNATTTGLLFMVANQKTLIIFKFIIFLNLKDDVEFTLSIL